MNTVDAPFLARGQRCNRALPGTVLAVTALLAVRLNANPMVVQGDHVYYTDRGQIVEINTRLQTIAKLEREISVRQILVDAEHNLYATSLAYDAKTDMFRPTVWQLRGGGTGASPVVSSEQFSYSEVADAKGRLYFWQHEPSRGLSRLLFREKKGPLQLLAGHKIGQADGRGAEARLGRIGAMAAGPDGALYFTDEQSVRRVAPDGEVRTLARGGLLALGAGRTPANHLTSITVDERGTIFVADSATHRILTITPAGQVDTLSDNDDGWIPRSLAWTNGSLYLLETKDKITRAVRVDSDGSRRALVPEQRAPGSEKPIWLSDTAFPPRSRLLAHPAATDLLPAPRPVTSLPA